MNDMRAVIVPKSDQINAETLLAGPITITITEVTIRPGTEQPVSVHFANDEGKPWKPCKSMARVLVRCWGADANQYIGRSLTLYCDPKVKWGGLAVGGIRISHMSDISETMVMALTETKGSKKPFTVKPLAVEKEPASTQKRVSITEWLDLTETRLKAAETDDDVKAIIAETDVQKALAQFRNGALDRLKAMIASALAPHADDGAPVDDFPADATPEDPDLSDLRGELGRCKTLGQIATLEQNSAIRAKVRNLSPPAAEQWARDIEQAKAR